MDEFIGSLTTKQLQQILKSRGLSHSYKLKTDLVARLKQSLSEEDTEASFEELLNLERGSDDEYQDPEGDMSTNILFKDVEDALEKFSGESETDIGTWLNNFEDVSTTCKWNDIQKYLFARKLLIGAARKAIEGDRTVTSYALLKTKLETEFQEELTIIEIHEKLVKRKKLASETYLEYFYEIQKIAKGKMDEKSTIHYIINGIQDDADGKSLLYDCKKLDELKGKLKTYETIRNQRKTIVPGQTKMSVKKFHVAESSQSGASTSAAIRCFNCGSKSHQRNDCPDKAKGLRCFNCNDFGHRAKECRDNKADQGRATDKAKQIRTIGIIPQPEDAHIFVRHGNDEILAQVDSGSYVTVMKKSRFDKLQHRPDLKKTTTPFKGFGGVVSRTIGSADCLFTIDDDDYDVECHIVKDEHMSEDMLIGLDIINQAELTMKRGKVTMKRIIEVCEEEDENFISKMKAINFVNKSNEPDLSHIEDDNIRSEVQSMIKNYAPKIPEKSWVEMKVCVTDEIPIYEKARRLAPKERKIVNEMVQDWLERGICRASNSEYASPVLLRPKKNGLWRLCIDFRRINRKVIRDRFPMQIMDDVLDVLQGSQVYSNLDLKDGFFHVDVEKDSIKYLSFITPDGQYECLKAPFGFANSPAVFQRFINMIFQKLMSQRVVAIYLDDLAVPGKNMAQGVENLKRVLAKAEENGLVINWKKCTILANRITFLGYVVENGTIKPSREKTEAVRKFPTPNNVQQVQSFLGLTGFFRKFIEDYAIIAKPLSDLTRKDVNFEFGETQQEAFITLKAILCDNPVLKMFNPDAEVTELHTDASKFGLGAVLMQKDSEDQKMHPVCYLSFKTTPTQQKFESYDLETFAIYQGLKKLRIYLLGLKFQVFTDCQAFQRSMLKKELIQRIAKWALYISQFDCELIHRAGTKMKHVDALSRIPRIMLIEDGLVAKIKQMQREDDRCKTIQKILETKSYENYINRCGVLYKFIEGITLLVIPKKMQRELIRSIHEKGHLNAKKVETMVRQDYFIEKLNEKIVEVIGNCIKCILANRKDGKKDGLLNPIEKGDAPLHTYHIDHLGPLDSTAKSYKHLLVVIDAFSKFTWIYPVKSTGLEELVKKLELQREVFGNPFCIIADRAGVFRSKEFETYCNENNINRHLITTGVPRGNGQVERINRIIIPVLTKMSNENPQQWYRHTAKLQTVLNSTMNRSTGKTPFEILVGVKMRTNEDFKLAEQLEEALKNEFFEERTAMRKLAKENIAKLQEENRKSYNRNRKPAIKYKIGDFVAIQRTQFGGGLKLRGKFLGPYEVTQIKRNDRYGVIKVGQHEGPNITSTAADLMKPWANLYNDECTSSEADE